ncbi:glycoside hydrolase [Agaribacter marinus]|uniref:Glycosyl hydrolase n=1 Tax=Agaribacter marinus TaxID=1431249 RepID=A0AA37WLD1_9ALTE|nr:glycoside hydrolase [Agaribacter marinus]GLR71945.1 hypothetical protein GCM10007852_28530 [Agaribacter marinus]
MLFKFALINLAFFIEMFLCNFVFASQPIQLTDDNGQIVSIEPSTLMINWKGIPINRPALKVANELQDIAHLKRLSQKHVQWTLLPSNIKVDAVIGETLELTFSLLNTDNIERNKPLQLEWFNLASEATQVLYLPFNEGMRVPIDNQAWIEYLTKSRNASNTTQDLKMPFWTARLGEIFVSWHLVTATDNKLFFSSASEKLNMQSSHYFTVLNSHQAFKVSVSLGEHMLDGAKQYRHWRIDKGSATPLSSKQKKNRSIAKLVGASHVYLFGRDGISKEDVKHWKGLIKWLLAQSTFKLDSKNRSELEALVDGRRWISNYYKQTIIDKINRSLDTMYSVPAPTMLNNTIETQYTAAQSKKKWLMNNAGQYLNDSAYWGQAISKDMVGLLQSTGLSRLWLGLDNWLPAFYQPEVIESAKSAGYLVGTYDSYNTALPRGVNDAWLSAQLPEKMRESCAIELADGIKKAGFRGKGFYLNPLCESAYVLRRVSDVVKFGRFDSLFLDVDATGMAREDYHLNTSEQQMLAGFNKRLEDVVEISQVVLGSEDGNSLTASGITFAHGLETSIFGWHDIEMMKDRSSPYYLGRWYPDHKPDFFFKPAKVKEPYRTLLFSPQYRVPLYQAVFHDELISSHHWHFDSLKFSNVKVERDLLAMLYNVPAMVHLSRDDANSNGGARLMQLKHYQKAFLHIHEALWDKQLVDFKWLDVNGDIQQTAFSDGSKIIANFSDKAFPALGKDVAPKSITAVLVNMPPFSWKPMEVGG